MVSRSEHSCVPTSYIGFSVTYKYILGITFCVIIIINLIFFNFKTHRTYFYERSRNCSGLMKLVIFFHNVFWPNLSRELNTINLSLCYWWRWVTCCVSATKKCACLLAEIWKVYTKACIINKTIIVIRGKTIIVISVSCFVIW